MQRWIIPVGVAAIVVSLAALTILVASYSVQSDLDAEQDPGQIEEPETGEPEPAPEPEVEPESPEPEGLEPEGPDPENPAPGDEAPENPEGFENPGGLEGQGNQPVPRGQDDQEEENPQLDVQPGPSTATIEITGDSAYYCSAGVIGDPRTVEGRRPTNYEVEIETGGTALETVMAACQKISPGGNLGVNIVYDDEIVAEDETSNRLGTVNVSWSPLEE